MQISSCTYSNRNQSLAFVFPICFWADSFSSSQEPIIWQAWCLLYILSSTWSCELKSDITSVKFACTLAGTPVQRMGLNRPLQHLWQLQVIMSWLLCMSAVWIWEHTGIVMLTAATGAFVNTVQCFQSIIPCMLFPVTTCTKSGSNHQHSSLCCGCG